MIYEICSQKNHNYVYIFGPQIMDVQHDKKYSNVMIILKKNSHFSDECLEHEVIRYMLASNIIQIYN